MGIEECAPRTVGVRETRVAQRTYVCIPDLARQGLARRPGARVDTRNKRSGHGVRGARGAAAHSCDAESAHDLLRVTAHESERPDRARWRTAARSRYHLPLASPPRRCDGACE